jgi:hypothetical protein
LNAAKEIEMSTEAVDSALASGQASAADQARLMEGMSQIQSEMAASKAKADIDQAVSRNTQEMAGKIK